MLNVYCYSKCSTCKKALAWLEAHGIAHQVIDIKADKNDPKKTVFAFLKDAKFESDFNTVINDISDERSHRKAAEKKVESKEEK